MYGIYVNPDLVTRFTTEIVSAWSDMHTTCKPMFFLLIAFWNESLTTHAAIEHTFQGFFDAPLKKFCRAISVLPVMAISETITASFCFSHVRNTGSLM